MKIVSSRSVGLGGEMSKSVEYKEPGSKVKV